MANSAVVGSGVFGVYLGGDSPPYLTVGMVATGSPNVFVGGVPRAGVGSLVVHSYGVGVVVTGSSRVIVNGAGVARIGDLAMLDPGYAWITSGDPTVLSD
jgi:uncharacterized Zn-binding protein involved in type VI secretion